MQDITFIGQDYRPIDDATERAVEKYGESASYWRQVLDCFLQKVAPNGFVNDDVYFVNVSSDDKQKRQLYDLNFGTGDKKGYFCGIIGVIRTDISFRPESEEMTMTENGVLEDCISFRITLQIVSRLDVGENAEKPVMGKPFFLSTLLLRDKIVFSNETVPNSQDAVLDYLLLAWFKEQLQRAYLKGYYKTYRRFENNNDRLKGSIDFARHIRLNIGQNNGSIAYSYRENTINNFLNQLIVVAYHHLKKKYYELVLTNFDNNRDLKQIIDYLSYEVGYTGNNEKNLINKNVKPISHPYYTEYEQLRVTCLSILRDEGISIFDGKNDNQTSGLLFYLPDLWEFFLRDELLDKIPTINYKYQYLVSNFGYVDDNLSPTKFTQKTYPDFVFFYNDTPFMILDAKCKPGWGEVFKFGTFSPGGERVMEDYNKCIRDMVAINAHSTGVLFPTNKTDEPNEKVYYHPISKYNTTDVFYTIPIQVPQSRADMTFLQWKAEFDNNITKARYLLEEIIEDRNRENL